MERVANSAYVRLGLVGVVAVYGFLCAREPEEWRLLDGVDLLLHEAGHLIFAPFGEFIGVLGGTLMQLLIPALFPVYFARHGQRFAASVTLFWVAQSLFNVSVYARDARARQLPLLGDDGAIHDWAYLLDRVDLLAHDQTIGGLIHVVGVLLYLYSVIQGFFYARAEIAA